MHDTKGSSRKDATKKDLLKSSKTALPIKSQFSKQMNRHDRNNKENKKNDATKKKSHPLVGQRQQHHKLNHNKRDLKGKELHDKKEKKKSSGKQLNETKNQDASVKNKVCEFCSTTETWRWRKGPTNFLCNACWARWKMKRQLPPASPEENRDRKRFKSGHKLPEPEGEDINVDSVLCENCNDGGDEEKLVLCDDCPRGFHLYCLTPSLSAVPRGYWVCPLCTIASAGNKAQGKARSTCNKISKTDVDSEEIDLDDTAILLHIEQKWQPFFKIFHRH